MLLRLPILLLALVDQAMQAAAQLLAPLLLLAVGLGTAVVRLTRAALAAPVAAADSAGVAEQEIRLAHLHRKAVMAEQDQPARLITAQAVVAARLQQAVLQLARLAAMVETARLRLLAAVL